MFLRKILDLIPERFRRRGVSVFLSVPLRALLDLVGVAVLIPVLVLVLDPDQVISNPFFFKLYQWTGVEGRQFAIAVICGVIALVVVKSLLNLLLVNYQNRYLLSLYKHFSAKLFSSLYRKGLLFIKNSNTSELAYNINAVCYNFVVVYLASILRFCGNFIFSLFLIVFLAVYNPLSALLVFCSMTPVAAVYLLFVRRKLKQYGKGEMEARRNQQKLVLETFKGYAEMEINGAFPLVERRFKEGLGSIYNFRVKSLLIQSIPAYLLEGAVVLIVSLMVLFSLNAADSSIRVFLGVFAVAMLRMLPAVHSLIGTWSNMKASQYTIEIIESFNEDGAKVDVESPNISFEDKIEVENLSFSYSGDNECVVKNLNFTIRKGARFGIKGRTGSGKSTLFNLLLGFFAPTQGSIKIDGHPLDAESVSAWQSLVGYVPQDVFIADLTLGENVALGCDPDEIDTSRLEESLKRAALWDFVSSLPEGANTKIGEGGCRISGGQRQRIGIARALYKGAQVLFLDEATSSLDVDTENEISKSIEMLSHKEKGMTIIIISHRESTLELCESILEL